MATNIGSLLGQGILRPFRRDQKQDFANDTDLANVRACVGQVLGTQCSVPGTDIQGELPWMPEFGSMLYRLRHKKGHMLQELARVYIVDALQRWEPRVSITSSSVEMDLEQRTLTIRIMYDVIDQNNPSNGVVHEDVDQTVLVPLAA